MQGALNSSLDLAIDVAPTQAPHGSSSLFLLPKCGVEENEERQRYARGDQ